MIEGVRRAGVEKKIWRHNDLGHLIARWQKSRFCSHFSRKVVSDFQSLRGNIASGPFLARLSPATKIPFQTRIGQADRNSYVIGGFSLLSGFLRFTGFEPTRPAPRSSWLRPI